MIRVECTAESGEEMVALMAWLDLGQDGPGVFEELGELPFQFSVSMEHCDDGDEL